MTIRLSSAAHSEQGPVSTDSLFWVNFSSHIPGGGGIGSHYMVLVVR